MTNFKVQMSNDKGERLRLRFRLRGNDKWNIGRME